MNRRDWLRGVTGAVASLAVPAALVGQVQGLALGAGERSPLRQEADIVFAMEGFDLALKLYGEVLKAYRRSAGIGSEALADVVSFMEQCRLELTWDRERLKQQMEDGPEGPDDERRCWHYEVGRTLWHLGRDDEALAEFREALDFQGEPCDHCSVYSLNNIGCYYLVRHEYETALGWFRRGCGNPNDRKSEIAMLNMILTLVEMGATGEAERVIHQYVRQFGRRIPWLHREVLKQAGIDADRLFLDIRGVEFFAHADFRELFSY